MADEKKPSVAKPAEHQSDSKTVEQIVSLLAGLLLLGAMANALFNYIDNFDLSASNSVLSYFFEHIWPIWKVIAVVLSALAFVGIIYNSRKLAAINLAEQQIYGAPPESVASVQGEPVGSKNKKWEKIIGYMHGGNASDWRIAIMEADVMLEELLRTLGYHGESVGEMLKSVDKNEFRTIEDAWEAHKTRNAVAHSRGDFQLTERETKRTLALFEKVFVEFDII